MRIVLNELLVLKTDSTPEVDSTRVLNVRINGDSAPATLPAEVANQRIDDRCPESSTTNTGTEHEIDPALVMPIVEKVVLRETNSDPVLLNQKALDAGRTPSGVLVQNLLIGQWPAAPLLVETGIIEQISQYVEIPWIGWPEDGYVKLDGLVFHGNILPR